MTKHLSILLMLILGVLSACNESKDNKDEGSDDSKTKDSVIVKEPTIAYGFVLDSFVVVNDTVKENQTLSHLFLPHGINQAEINTLYNLSIDSLVGLSYITTGKPYTVLYHQGDTSRAAYLIYENNTIDYFIFDLNADKLEVSKHQKEIQTETRQTAGVISSSLWNAFIDQGLTPDLVMRVVNTYQWSVDFFSIQKGDSYKIVYDERSVEGTPISAGKIHALEIHTFDSAYYAIPFESGDTITGYFDGEGGSLRKALLKAPLDYLRISSGFSYNRLHPVLGYRRPHLGVDYAAPSGTPVVSVGDGTVIFSGWGGGGGNTIKVKHNQNIVTYYLHLRKRNVSVGDHVDQGQLIGEVGSTGISTGPHLDYRIQINGKFVDPVSADIPTSEPLPEVLVPEFMVLRDSLVNILSKISVPDINQSHAAELDAHRDSVEKSIEHDAH